MWLYIYLWSYPSGSCPNFFGEPVPAGVVHASHAPAFTSPVAVGVHILVEPGLLVYTAPPSHCHVVGRIETAGAQVADCACLFPLPVYQVFAAQRVAAGPPPATDCASAEIDHGLKVERIAETVGQHHRLVFEEG